VVLLPPGPGGETFAVFRLTDVGRVIGVLGLALSAPPDAAGNRILRVLADHLSVALANARLHEQMTVLARIDDLTGIENRRAGMACLEDEILRSVHTGQPLGLLLLDLDHFKAVNDTYGHRVGDRVLVHVTRVCRAALRPADTLARYGGEELIAILPGADVDAVTAIAERLRRDVAATPARRPEGDAVGVTLTAGGISWTPTVAATDTDALLTAADLALYAGKSDGRNRSVIRSFPPSSDDPVTVSRADAGSA
jgi:diguanylate cyclase (GGDEF)-like protein